MFLNDVFARVLVNNWPITEYFISKWEHKGALYGHCFVPTRVGERFKVEYSWEDLDVPPDHDIAITLVGDGARLRDSIVRRSRKRLLHEEMRGENGDFYEMMVRPAPTTDEETNPLARSSRFGELEVQVYSLPRACRTTSILAPYFEGFRSPPIPEGKGSMIHAIGQGNVTASSDRVSYANVLQGELTLLRVFQFTFLSPSQMVEHGFRRSITSSELSEQFPEGKEEDTAGDSNDNPIVISDDDSDEDEDDSHDEVMSSDP